MPTITESIIFAGFNHDIAWWKANCPAGRRRPKSAKDICGIDWATTGPGMSWPEWYYISSNRSGSHWIFWGQADQEVYDGIYPYDWEASSIDTAHDSYNQDCIPLAWCPRQRMTMKRASTLLLQAYWRNLIHECGGEDGRPIFEDVLSGGLISEKEVHSLAREVWVGNRPTGEFYGRVVNLNTNRSDGICRCYFSFNGHIARIDLADGSSIQLDRIHTENEPGDALVMTGEDAAGDTWEITPE